MDTRRVVRVHEPGGPEVLRLDELPIAAPGPGQARVRVAAAGVNYIDIQHRSGNYQVPLPFAIGIEGAGTVEVVGPGTANGEVRPGDRVAWVQVQGSYATHVVAPVEKLVPLPERLALETGAAVLEHGMTAHYLVRSAYPLKAGETCLVHAAAGGVGQFLCQFATRAGAQVIATVSTEAKERVARAAGAERVIRYTEQDFVAEVKRLTGGRGVDVVYDGVGRATFLKDLDCIRPRGTLVFFGEASGGVEGFEPRMLLVKGSLYLTRPSLNHYTLTTDEYRKRAADVLDGIASGSLRARIDRTLPLAQAADAHRALERRETMGKVLLLA